MPLSVVHYMVSIDTIGHSLWSLKGFGRKVACLCPKYRCCRGISLERLETQENLRVSSLGTQIRTSDILNTNELV